MAVEVNKHRKVTLSKVELRKDIEERGLRRPEMAEKYGLSVGQLKRAIEQAGLKNLKAKKIDFVFEEDLEENKEEVKETKEEEVTDNESSNGEFDIVTRSSN